jgi:4-hydroxybenzoate polyprenyltransferase
VNYALKNIWGLIKTSRIPNLLIAALVQLFTALFLLDEPSLILTDLRFLLFILSTLMIAAGGYVINDYYDQKIDMVNRPTKVVIGIQLYRRPAMLSHFLFSVAGITIGFWLNTYVGIIHIFSAVTLWYYSNHLKRLPLLGNLAIAGLAGLLLLIVAIYFHKINKLVLIYALFASVVALIQEIIKDIEAAKGESTFGCSTVPVIWGVLVAKYLIYLISALGTILLTLYLIIGAGLAVQIYFACISPVFLWFLYQIHVADTQKKYRTLHTISNWIILSGILSIPFT